MTSEKAPSAQFLLRLVVLAILGWGLYLVLGAWLVRPARALVLAVCFGGFLGFWWLAWQWRKRRELHVGDEPVEPQ